MAQIIARRVAKITLYILLSLVVGRTIGPPEIWLDHDLATRLALIIYGPGDIGCENFDDFYFYVSVITIFSITTVSYILTIKLIRKIRSR
ncbi:hypothetical protein TUM12370_37390 [Salmonella enterica subsp. enterica serovar Choleraesuis]|nr:hypothetical protein TUM12370_37390 [Salmonella enterica subsp. enterica serovar Choleraesuis]